MSTASLQHFEPLRAIHGLRHGFVLRDPDTSVDTSDREEVLRRLRPHYRRVLAPEGFDFDRLQLAEQVHGADVAVVGKEPGDVVVAGVDGLVTSASGVDLGIFVADCCAVFLVDPVRRACGLVHSGRKGSEEGIAAVAVRSMQEHCGSRPQDLIAVLSPCIRPPNYEIDFAALIRGGCVAAGLLAGHVYDSGADTAGDLNRYYSYRIERGHTGRMLAVIGWQSGEK